MSLRDKEIINNINLLANKDELFFIKHSIRDIENILGLKKNTLPAILSKNKFSIREKREQEFINYFYKQNIETITLPKIAKDLNYNSRQQVYKKIKQVFGCTLKELKRSKNK